MIYFSVESKSKDIILKIHKDSYYNYQIYNHMKEGLKGKAKMHWGIKVYAYKMETE